MIVRCAAIFLLVGAAVADAQQVPPNFFTCLEPSRLTPRTATYFVKGGTADYKDVEVVEGVQEGGRSLLRLTRTRYRDEVMTSAQIVHVDARTLAPLSFLHSSARTPDRPPAELAIRNAQLAGHSYGNQAVSQDTKGEPVLFGSATPDMLIVAINFDRCPSVTGMHLSVSDGLLKPDVEIEKIGDGTFTLDGRQLSVHELRLTVSGYPSTLHVTKSAPYVVVQHTHTTPPTTKTLIKLQ